MISPWISLLVGIISALVAVWVLLRYVIPFLLPLLVNRMTGTTWACSLKLWLGVYSNGGGLTAVTVGEKTFFHGEHALASELRQQVPGLTEPDYRQRTLFLERADDADRTSERWPEMLFLTLLTIVEGIGLALTLGNFITDAVDKTVAFWMGILISVIIGIVFSRLMHSAGENYYRHSQMTKARKAYLQQGLEGEEFPTVLVGLADDQNKDNLKPGWMQLANRVQSKGLGTFWAAIFLVSFVLVAITVFRVYDPSLAAGPLAENQTTKQPENPFNNVTTGPKNDGGNNSGSNPFLSDTEKPDTTSVATPSSDKNLAGVAISLQSWAAFLILGVVFAATQGYGILRGYRNCFGSDSSKQALEETCRTNSWDQYCEYRRKYIISCNDLLSKWRMKVISKMNLKASPKEMRDFFEECKIES